MRAGFALRPLTRRRFLAGAGALATAGLAPPSLAGGGESDLVLAFIPQENPEKLLGDIAIVTNWLSSALGGPVRGFVTSSIAAAVESLRFGDADISFMGALPFVIAEAGIGAVPVLQEVYRGAASYHGRIFVRRGQGISALADLRGRTIAFADPLSESGYLYPLDLFVEAGLLTRDQDPQRFFSRVYFAGGYQQALLAIANGLVDAAGASQYADLLLDPAQQAAVTFIAETEPIPSHVVIARSGLESETLAAFRAAMLSLNDPENTHLLQHLYSPDGYVAADPASFDGVRALARAYDLID